MLRQGDPSQCFLHGKIPNRGLKGTVIEEDEDGGGWGWGLVLQTLINH